MTTRKSSPPPDSEEELLEQWAFLDRLVERQAAQLRAGIQDTEETDEPPAELEALRRDVEKLRAELRRAQAAREAAEAEARRSRDALIALSATHQRHLGDSERARQQQAVLEQGVTRWRERAEAAERARAGEDERGREELADLARRLTEAQTARERLEREYAEAAAALSDAHLEVQSLRTQLASTQHGFWRFGRR